MTLHDVANAFPSPTHPVMDRAVNRCSREEDARLLQHRCMDTRMVVRSCDGARVVAAPGSGRLQGDANVAPMFSAMYDERMVEWDAKCQEDEDVWMLRAVRPVAGQELQIAPTAYADDVAETNSTRDAEQFVHVVRDSDSALDAALALTGTRQHGAKREQLPMFMCKGPVGATRRLMKSTDVTGKVLQRARYLGNIRQADGGHQANVDCRRTAARGGRSTCCAGYGDPG